MKRRLIIVAVALSAAIATAAEPATPWQFSAASLRPFWLSQTMEGESVLFILDKAGGRPAASLLFEPTRIVSVVSSSGEVRYEEGRDYVWQPGSKQLSLPPGSRIVFRTPQDLRRPAGSQPYRLTHRDGNGELLFGATHEYHDLQTVVTYAHRGGWSGPKPSFAGEQLPRTLKRLSEKQPLTIALLGDSISTGCNASGWAKVAPFQPPYQDLLVMNIEAAYGADVTLHNFAVSGTDTAWGLANIGKVIGAQPDLAILAFGMNDAAGRPANEYQANIRAMLEAVRRAQPDAEFILVATMLGNQNWTALRHERFPQYRDALQELCGPGIALADLTSVWAELLKHKQDWDLTGNGVNHPNDFGHRVYAQFLSSLLVPMAADDVDMDATFAAVATYRYGDSRKPLHALQQLVRYATRLGAEDTSGFRGRLADRLAALLASQDVTPAGKTFLCEQLAAIGTEKHASAVASLLADKETAAAALGTLEQIPGAAVDSILRDALRTTEGNLQIGVVHALGQRRDRAAVESLRPMLAAGDEPLASAAASALGKIGGDAAVEALKRAWASAQGRLRTEVADACLTCADQMLAAGQSGPAAALYTQLSGPSETEQVRMAALRGTLRANPEKAVGIVCQALTSGDAALENMALQLVPQVSGAGATEQLAQCLRKLPPSLQCLALNALAVRGDVAARSAVEGTLSSADPAVRIAALNALGTLGDETTVNLLVDRIKAGTGAPEGDAARNGLKRLRGPRVDEVVTGLLPQGDTGLKIELIRMLAARNARVAIAALETAAEDPDATVRKEAWKALTGLARAQDLRSMLELLVRARDDERPDAEKAVAAVLRIPDRPDLGELLQQLDTVQPAPARCSLVRIASVIGDDGALPAVRKELQSDDARVRDAAIRSLAAWPTPAPLEDLVNLARTARESVHRILALRAAVRLSSKAQGRTPEQMTALVTELMQLAKELAERKAVLAELGRCATWDALQLARKYLDDPELATEAGAAVTQIASAVRDTHRDQALAALLPLLAGNRDAAVAGRAGKVLKDILTPANLARGATATSPDSLEADGTSGGDNAAIDGDPHTYWDETDNADEYRLRVTFAEPKEVSSIDILWHPYEQHQAKNLDVLCDGKVVAEVRKANCFDNEMFVAFAPIRCTWVELVIPGKNGLVSPAVHEFQIFGNFPPPVAGHETGKKS